MKKAFSFVLAAILIACIFSIGVPVSKAAGFSKEDGNIKATITPSPASRLEGGDVNFTVVIQNKQSEKEITDIDIDYSGITKQSIASIAAGGTGDTSFVMNIPTNKLGTGLVFNISYSMEGSPYGFNVTAKVEKQMPKAELGKKCTVNRLGAPAGEDINFTIILENTGQATLTDMVLTLPPIYNKKLPNQKFSSMVPGTKKTIIYTHTMKEDVTVTPTVQYKANGETVVETFNVKNLVIANSGLDLKLSADNKAPALGEEVNFTLKVMNTGNVKMSNISIFNHLQEEVKKGLTLSVGGTGVTYTYKYPFSQTTPVVFTANAKDGDGQIYSYKSNEVVISIPIDQNKIKLDIKAVANVYELDEAGAVKFKITVTNSGEYSLNEIAVTEPALGDIGVLDTLEAGEKLFEATANVSKTTTYTFKVTAKDADGVEHTAESLPIEIKVSEAPATSNPLSGATDLPDVKTGVKGNTLGTIMIIIGVISALIIAVVAALIIMVRKEKRGRSKASHAGASKTVKYKKRNNF